MVVAGHVSDAAFAADTSKTVLAHLAVDAPCYLAMSVGKAYTTFGVLQGER